MNNLFTCGTTSRVYVFLFLIFFSSCILIYHVFRSCSPLSPLHSLPSTLSLPSPLTLHLPLILSQQTLSSLFSTLFSSSLPSPTLLCTAIFPSTFSVCHLLFSFRFDLFKMLSLKMVKVQRCKESEKAQSSLKTTEKRKEGEKMGLNIQLATSYLKSEHREQRTGKEKGLNVQAGT